MERFRVSGLRSRKSVFEGGFSGSTFRVAAFGVQVSVFGGKGAKPGKLVPSLAEARSELEV